MSESLSRAYVADLEVRASGDGRVIGGIVVPYERTARVSDGGPAYSEQFARGAFTRTLQHRGDRVKFLSQHNARSNPLGVAVGDSWRDDAAGLYGEFRVSKTQAGDEALALVRDGALDSFSVGFTPIKHEKKDGVVVRTEVRLNEVSLVTFPAYEDARVLAVRDATAADLISRGYTPQSVESALEFGDLTLLEHAGAQPVVFKVDGARIAAELRALKASGTTPDGDSDQAAQDVSDPASATRDDYLTHFKHNRKVVRDKEII